MFENMYDESLWQQIKDWLIGNYIYYTYQKLTRGFSDEVTWDLDYEIAKWVLPRLKRFKELCSGVPSNLTEQEWYGILDKMIVSFELIIRWEDEWPIENDVITREGLKLFGEYFRALWD